jgi:thiosulfate/3-mercaptopyruvate sulfurtransferase
MKKRLLLIPLAVSLVLGLVTIGHPAAAAPPSPPARALDAIVSTQWLEDNIDNPDLVILDVRDTNCYTDGHIPGSINVPASGNFFLCIMDPNCGLWMEVPPDDSLFTTIGDAGITPNATVVVIARTVDSPTLGPAKFGVTMAARAAITLLYAGVKNVAMLNGGYGKWAVEGRATSTEPVTPTAVVYDGATNDAMFVLKDYVEDKVGKSTLLDTREADSYFGIKQDPSSVRLGHIPTSKVLPAPWFWDTSKDEDGATMYMTWKDTDAVSEIALTILGENADKEIIIYCGVGGYASPVYYVLSEVVGYTNVKFYDGSMQEWTADPEAPVTKYKCE